MKQTEWASVLSEIKNNLRKRIIPLLKTPNRSQPNLGIGAGGDPIGEADLAAENAIIDTLKAEGISFTLVSEESGIREYGENPRDWYVTTDPIDGSTNLKRGIPFNATSIAVSTKPTLNTIHTALVADLAHGTTYMAQKGKGATRDGKKIVPSKRASLDDAVVGLDLNTSRVREIVPQLTNIVSRTKHIRHFGANALELCYVADGTTDAFIDIRGKLRATDIAASWLIVKEAGAIITTPDGEPLNVELSPKQHVSFIAAGNVEIHRIILDMMKAEKESK